MKIHFMSFVSILMISSTASALTASVAAQAAPPAPDLWILAQRSTEDGVEQVSIAFEKDKAVLTTNSNFLKPGKGPLAELGTFEAPLSPGLKARRDYLRQIQARVGRPLSGASAPPAGSPHRIQYRIGPVELSPASPYFKIVSRMLREAERFAPWKPAEAVRVEARRESGQSRFWLTRLPERNGAPEELAARSCEKRTSALTLCRVPRFGLAYLRD